MGSGAVQKFALFSAAEKGLYRILYSLCTIIYGTQVGNSPGWVTYRPPREAVETCPLLGGATEVTKKEMSEAPCGVTGSLNKHGRHAPENPHTDT